MAAAVHVAIGSGALRMHRLLATSTPTNQPSTMRAGRCGGHWSNSGQTSNWRLMGEPRRRGSHLMVKKLWTMVLRVLRDMCFRFLESTTFVPIPLHHFRRLEPFLFKLVVTQSNRPAWSLIWCVFSFVFRPMYLSHTTTTLSHFFLPWVA